MTRPALTRGAGEATTTNTSALALVAAPVSTAVHPQGQVTNHYKEEWWDLFNIPSVERPSAYDGHTPQVAAARLLQYIEEEQI